MKKGMVFGVIAALLCAAVCMGYVRFLRQTEDAEAGEVEVRFSTEAETPESYDREYRVCVWMDGEQTEMPLHEYLVGVLLAEMPASFEMEALKAQAVAARTFTLKQIANGKHDGAICTQSSCCQAWISTTDYLAADGSGGEGAVKKMEQAVTETDGYVVEYNGMLIDAVFFSCSGGMTEAAVEVWGNDVPYLQAVESPGEEDAAPYTDTLTVSVDTFRQVMEELSEDVDLTGSPDTWFAVPAYTAGGGVDTVAIGGVEFTGKTLRSAFGLRSTKFSVSVTDTEITFHTMGYGHRVGMSQYGADAMARNGASFEEILLHYYQGTQLERLP